MPQTSEPTMTTDGVHVVSVEADDTAAGTHYNLNEEALRSILLADNVKDKPVAVISVAGAYRGGKSFLLNFFLRYLSAPDAAREDGSWMGDREGELTGFSWRGGSVRNTTGIVMWSQPFFVRSASGQEVAVFLMDTQGTFDDTSSIRDCSTIFALSTLLASTQIFNIRNNIKENDLQTLQLFTDYGKLMKDDTGKPFQVLEFLIRDWINPYEFPYGQAGGDSYLAEKLKISKEQPQELQDLRKHILSSFEKVTCFLLPIPSLDIANPNFKGKLVELQPSFANGVTELVTSILGKEKILSKHIGEQSLTCRDLFNYFKTYMSIFNSDKNPTPKTILMATTEAGLLLAANDAREQFEDNMNQACGPDAPSMPSEDVVIIHAQQLAAARVTFNKKKLFGDRALIDAKLDELYKELSKRQNDFLDMNQLKVMKAQNKGNAAYDASIENLKQGKVLCVHAKDLKAVHEEALAAAKIAFDENRRKPIEGKKDTEREKYINSFETKYEVLRLTNEQNNKANASEIKMDYSQYMMVKCNQKPKLTNNELKVEHEKAMARAFDEFDSRRNRGNNYGEDTYKYQLEQGILFEYELLKQINASSNTEAFQSAIYLYNNSFLSISEIRKHCLHPDDLKKNHEEAMCLALQVFRPSIICDADYKAKDNDEIILMSVFNNRYEALSDINRSANEAAVNEAFVKYKEVFESQCGFFYFLSTWETATEYHIIALSDAYDVFYSLRRDRKYHAYDEYIESLRKKAKHYYDPKNKA